MGLTKVMESACFFKHPLIEKQKLDAPQARKNVAKNIIVQGGHTPRIIGKKKLQKHKSVSHPVAGAKKN